MTYDIFISYRRRMDGENKRKGGDETAKHLHDLLKADGYNVSFDIDTLRNGDFAIQLLKRIDECTDFLLILSEGVFDRCFEADKTKDWVRCELAYALERGKNIIPIMLAGFTEFPDNLPDDIAKVSCMNGPKYDQYYFDSFYEKLKKDFLETTPNLDQKSASDKSENQISKTGKSENNNCQLVVFAENGKYGFKDEKTEDIIIPSRYDEALDFKEDMAVVKIGRKYGFIDRTGEIVVPLKYKFAESFNNGLACVAEVCFGSPENRKYWYIDKTGEIVISLKYNMIAYSFSEGLALIKKFPHFFNFDPAHRIKCGFIDTSGKTVIPFRYYDEAHSFNEGFALVGKVTVDLIFFRIFKYGFIDKKGSEVIPLKYRSATSFSNGLAKVKYNGKWGAIDKCGKEVIPCTFAKEDVDIERSKFISEKERINNVT